MTLPHTVVIQLTIDNSELYHDQWYYRYANNTTNSIGISSAFVYKHRQIRLSIIALFVKNMCRKYLQGNPTAKKLSFFIQRTDLCHFQNIMLYFYKIYMCTNEAS